MCGRVNFLTWKLSFAILTLLLLAGGAHAYVGPEADPATVGYFFSLMAWLVVALSSVLLYPLYALIRFFRRGRGASETPSAVSTVSLTDGMTVPVAPSESVPAVDSQSPAP
jgi:hypothetical protein